MPTIEALNPDVPLYARTGINLASAGLGARPVSCSNEFFAPVSRMLQDSEAVFIADKFDDNGKWMDGWETERRRNGGHDHAVIQLARAGRVLGFDIDTSHFTGNYAPACKVEATSTTGPIDDSTTWVPILNHSPLGPSSHHFFPCQSFESWTHLRLHIYP
ncbi:MAG: allantoicase, partial [Pseudomonadota bacterium]